MKNVRISPIFRVGITAILLFGWLNAYPIPPVSALAADIHYVAIPGADSGPCTNAAAPCATIEYAMDQATAEDTIQIGKGTFVSVRQAVDKNLAFQGAGEDLTIVDGRFFGPVFNLPHLNTVIRDLTITHGSPGVGACGGGIVQFEGTLTLENVRVTYNAASCGAGIASTGSVLIVDSEFSHNMAAYDPTSAAGGIQLTGIGTTAILTNVTIHNNFTSSHVGGLFIYMDNRSAGFVLLRNVTISANTAKINSAAAFTAYASITMVNSTIAGNHLSGEAGSENGGIEVDMASMTVKNSIIANNDDSNCRISSDPSTTWTSQGNNIDSDGTCRFTKAALHDRQAIDPMLAPLANNGGPHQTMALRPGSPAIDGVTYNAPNNCPTTDGRGRLRPFGPFCDIGAFEYPLAAIFLPLIKK